MSKIKYTKYCNALTKSRKQYKDVIGKKIKYREIANIGIDGCRNFGRNGDAKLKTNAILDCVRVATELNVIEKGKSINFFFTDIKFCKWLVSCVVNEISSDIVNEFHKKYGAPCLFHFPENEEFSSFMVVNGQNVDIKYLSERGVKLKFAENMNPVYYFNEDDNACYDLREFDYKSEDEISAVTDEDRNRSRYHFRIYAGLCLYLECFPDMVKNGIPEDFDKAFDFNVFTSRTIGISDKITFTEHESPCAHYRHGHFRTLRSEKFTNKRYQVIFVKGCFVKGEAKTVLI